MVNNQETEVRYESAINMISQVLEGTYQDDSDKQRLMREHIMALASGKPVEIDRTLQKLWNHQDQEYDMSYAQLECGVDGLD